MKGMFGRGKRGTAPQAKGERGRIWGTGHSVGRMVDSDTGITKAGTRGKGNLGVNLLCRGIR